MWINVSKMYPTYFPSIVPEEQQAMNVPKLCSWGAKGDEWFHSLWRGFCDWIANLLTIYEEISVMDLGNCKSVDQLSGLLSKTAATTM